LKRLLALWPFGLLAACALSAVWPWIGLPAAFGAFLGVLSMPAAGESGAQPRRAAVGVAVLCASVGLLRFVIQIAMPGIVHGGRDAVEPGAVSRLRDVLTAQDSLRRSGWIDPDRDGIGSAASLTELCGGPPLRGQPARPDPILTCGDLVPTPLGPAARSSSYLYTVCLPGRDGHWSAQPNAAVDEEAAERHFIAYAWPAPGTSFEHVFYLDQDDNIWVAPRAAFNRRCDAALGERGPWQPWQGKHPRRGPLPGDHLPSEHSPGAR
jgi:hypothetical protein